MNMGHMLKIIVCAQFLIFSFVCASANDRQVSFHLDDGGIEAIESFCLARPARQPTKPAFERPEKSFKRPRLVSTLLGITVVKMQPPSDDVFTRAPSFFIDGESETLIVVDDPQEISIPSSRFDQRKSDAKLVSTKPTHRQLYGSFRQLIRDSSSFSIGSGDSNDGSFVISQAPSAHRLQSSSSTLPLIDTKPTCVVMQPALFPALKHKTSDRSSMVRLPALKVQPPRFAQTEIKELKERETLAIVEKHALQRIMEFEYSERQNVIEHELLQKQAQERKLAQELERKNRIFTRALKTVEDSESQARHILTGKIQQKFQDLLDIEYSECKKIIERESVSRHRLAGACQQQQLLLRQTPEYLEQQAAIDKMPATVGLAHATPFVMNWNWAERFDTKIGLIIHNTDGTFTINSLDSDSHFYNGITSRTPYVLPNGGTLRFNLNGKTSREIFIQQLETAGIYVHPWEGQFFVRPYGVISRTKTGEILIGHKKINEYTDQDEANAFGISPANLVFTIHNSSLNNMRFEWEFGDYCQRLAARSEEFLKALKANWDPLMNPKEYRHAQEYKQRQAILA